MGRFFSSSFKMGILGGGQLGKMMLYHTRQMDIHTSVLDPSAEAPCKIACNHFVQGDLLDFDTVVAFGKNLDVITIEIENVNIDALFELEKQGVSVRPSPRMLEIVCNKASQKKFYVDNGFPTTPFSYYNTLEELKQAVDNGHRSIPFVWKATSMGYDGKGVSVIKSKADLEKLADNPCIVEDLVEIEKELSIIVARRPNGDLKTYPLVEQEFHPTANLVEFIAAPARVLPVVERQAKQIAESLAEQLNLKGIMAIELFLDKNGNVLINEVAPRTHNSGHLTIENNYTSQFEQHLRCALDLPLGSTEMKSPAVMINLIGAEGNQGPVHYEGVADIFKTPGASVHFYGKKETRPFRKMGHITLIGDQLDEVISKAQALQGNIQVLSTNSLLF